MPINASIFLNIRPSIWNAYPAFILEIEQGIWINNFFIQLYREIGKVVEKLLCIPLLFSLVDISSIGSRWAKTNQVVMMANASATEAVNISEIEHNLGVLSSANLQTAKIFNSDGFVAWRSLWPRGGTEVESEVSRVLRGLPTENNVTYVKARSLLPREIVYNKFLTAFLEAKFPTGTLLQIYARQATTAGTISLQSSDAIAPVLVQIIIAHDELPLSMKIECGSRFIHLKGNGLVIVRDRATDITLHVENKDYTVVTLDYALPEKD